MQTVKDVLYKTALTFMLFILAVSPFSSVISEQMHKPFYLDFKSVMFFFALSVCIGVSFLIFRIKKLPKATKRIIHICIDYILILVFFLKYANSESQTLIVFFILTVIYMIVYPLLMLVSYFSDKLSKINSFKE